MDRVEEARQAWEVAQADLQQASDEMKRFVDEVADPSVVKIAFDRVERCRKLADERLQRYITQLGKS